MKKILLLTLVIMCFASCNKQEALKQQVEGGVVLFTSEIQTRATGTTWESDDEIGIYVLNSSDKAVVQANVPYKTPNTQGAFVPMTAAKIYYPADDEKIDFVAYYPYKEMFVIDDIYKVDVNSTKQNDLTKIDLMYSNNLVGKSISVLAQELLFEHQLSRVIVNLSSDAAIELKNAQVKLCGLSATADFDLKTGTLSNFGSKTDISLAIPASGTAYHGIMIPQSISEIVVEITLSNNKGEIFEVELPTSVVTNFVAGGDYIYNINVMESLGAAEN